MGRRRGDRTLPKTAEDILWKLEGAHGCGYPVAATERRASPNADPCRLLRRRRDVDRRNPSLERVGRLSWRTQAHAVHRARRDDGAWPVASPRVRDLPPGPRLLQGPPNARRP